MLFWILIFAVLGGLLRPRRYRPWGMWGPRPWGMGHRHHGPMGRGPRGAGRW